ncbi:hypothetical protein CK203_016931 [Vitis vinifera]|uniref:Endonuclease/exonuclease/phosphatase domain-containing protein n=1 Tax=Vitis vinifera TaxID=29760 RepID=A0A438JNK7_VITVI|nr:hypothetical protein CK203_016931 [Vitis vinifera]
MRYGTGSCSWGKRALGASHLNSILFDRTPGGGGEFYDHSGDLDEEVQADNTMWLTVYEACNERINGCKELGVIKSSSDKGRGMDGVGAHMMLKLREYCEKFRLQEIPRLESCECGGGSGGILICWDRRSLDILDWEEGQFTLSCRFRNVENGAIWVFTRVYGPFSKVERDALWEEFGAIRWLWEDPWCLGGDFNITLFPRERNSQRRISSAMKKFAEIVDDLGLVDLPFRGENLLGMGAKIIRLGQDWTGSLCLLAG